MAWHPFKRIGDALRNMFSGVRPPKQPDEPSEPTKRYSPPIGDGPRPSDNDILRDRAYDRIRGWHFEQYDDSRVRRNVYDRMDMLEIYRVHQMDREQFRYWAARDPNFWYH